MSDGRGGAPSVRTAAPPHGRTTTFSSADTNTASRSRRTRGSIRPLRSDGVMGPRVREDDNAFVRWFGHLA